MHIMLALGRPGKEELEASLGYRRRLCLSEGKEERRGEQDYIICCVNNAQKMS